jgi:hypothetical protein
VRVEVERFALARLRPRDPLDRALDLLDDARVLEDLRLVVAIF